MPQTQSSWDVVETRPIGRTAVNPWDVTDEIQISSPSLSKSQLKMQTSVPASYETPLSLKEETKFQTWKKKYAPRDSGIDYDLRGAFKAGLTPDPATGHWPDTFKKPNHPTFSVESKYAIGENAAKAGHWEGEKFVPPVSTFDRLMEEAKAEKRREQIHTGLPRVAGPEDFPAQRPQYVGPMVPGGPRTEIKPAHVPTVGELAGTSLLPVGQAVRELRERAPAEEILGPEYKVARSVLGMLLSTGQVSADVIEGLSTPMNLALLGSIVAAPAIGIPKLAVQLGGGVFSVAMAKNAGQRLSKAYDLYLKGDIVKAGEEVAGAGVDVIFAALTGRPLAKTALRAPVGKPRGGVMPKLEAIRPPAARPVVPLAWRPVTPTQEPVVQPGWTVAQETPIQAQPAPSVAQARPEQPPRMPQTREGVVAPQGISTETVRAIVANELSALKVAWKESRKAADDILTGKGAGGRREGVAEETSRYYDKLEADLKTKIRRLTGIKERYEAGEPREIAKRAAAGEGQYTGGIVGIPDQLRVYDLADQIAKELISETIRERPVTPQEPPAQPALEPWQMTWDDLVSSGRVLLEPDVYDSIKKNEGPDAMELVKGLNARGIPTLETHRLKNGQIDVRIILPAGKVAEFQRAGINLSEPWQDGTYNISVRPNGINALLDSSPPFNLEASLGWEARGDYEADLAEVHREHIEIALREGKPVPAKVLADYPDLKAGERLLLTKPSTPTRPPIPAPEVTELPGTIEFGKDKTYGGKKQFEAIRQHKTGMDELIVQEQSAGIWDVQRKTVDPTSKHYITQTETIASGLTRKEAKVAAEALLRGKPNPFREIQEGLPISAHEIGGGKLPIPGETTKYGGGAGWLTGNVEGKPAYSNGHILFFGEPPGPKSTGKGPDLDAFWKIAVTGVKGKRIPLKPIGISRSKSGIDQIWFDDAGTPINAKYYDFTIKKFPKAIFKRVEDSTGALEVFSEGDIVGLVMPMRMETIPPGIDKLLPKPAGTAPDITLGINVFGIPVEWPFGKARRTVAPKVSDRNSPEERKVTVVPRPEDLTPVLQQWFGSPSQQWGKISPSAGEIARKTIMADNAVARDTTKAMTEFSRTWRPLNEVQAKQVIRLLDDAAVSSSNLPRNLSPSQVEAYKWARNYLDVNLLRINEAREKSGAGIDPETGKYVPIKGMTGYWMHIFRGDWAVMKYDLKTGGWNPIETGWLAETLYDAEIRASEYLKNNPGTELKVEPKQIYFMANEATGLSRKAFFRLVNRLSKMETFELDPISGEPLVSPIGKETAFEMLEKVAFPKRKPGPPFFGHLLPRESNLPGWLDTPEALAMFIRASERYIQMAPLRAEVRTLVERVKTEAPGAINLQAEVDSFIDTAIAGKPDKFTRGFNNAWIMAGEKLGIPARWGALQRISGNVQMLQSMAKLGYSPVSAIVNLSQTPVNTYPVLGAKWTLRGIQDYTRGRNAHVLDELGIRDMKTKAEEATFRNYMAAQFPKSAGEIIPQSRRALIQTSLFMFRNAEQANRAIAALGAYARAYEGQGKPHAEAIRDAQDVLNRTQFQYGPTDAPAVLRRVWTRIPGQFKTFYFKEMEFILGLRGGEIPRFGIALLATAGALGIPGAMLLDEVVETLTGVSPLEKLRVKAHEIPGVAGFLTRAVLGGVPSAAGVDITRNIGFQEFLSPSTLQLRSLLGPTGSDVANLGRWITSGGIPSLVTGKPNREADEAKRRFWGGLNPTARRLWSAFGGGTGKLIDPVTGQVILDDIKPWEAGALALGFTPNRLAQERDVAQLFRRMIAKDASLRGGYSDVIADLFLQQDAAREGGDKKRLAALKEEINKMVADANAVGVGDNIVKAAWQRYRNLQDKRLDRMRRRAPKRLRSLLQEQIEVLNPTPISPEETPVENAIQ